MGEFNYDVKKSINQYKSDPLNRAYSHWIPQHEFVYCENKKIVDHVLRFENLDVELFDLFSKYGIANKMTKHSNKSHKEKKFGISDLYPEILELFNETYTKDFELFNYEKIYP